MSETYNTFAPTFTIFFGLVWIWRQDEMVCKHAEHWWLAPKSRLSNN